MAGNKILVADDSTTMQKVIRLALSNEGYEIQTVSDGNEAVQQIALFRPDLVLIDISLPGKNAFEVQAAANSDAMFGSTKFILMSSAFEKIDENQVKSANFHARLTRPFDPAQLRRLIADTLGGRSAKPSSSLFDETSEPSITSFTKKPAQTHEIPSRPTQTPATGQRPPVPQAPKPDMFSSRPAPPPPIPMPTYSDEPYAPAAPQPSFQTPPQPAPMPPKQTSQPAPPPPVPVFEQDSGNDIKNLTESTIRMSGLDDFDWKVQENYSEPAEDPVIPPSKSHFDEQESDFFKSAPIDFGSHEAQEEIPQSREYRGLEYGQEPEPTFEPRFDQKQAAPLPPPPQNPFSLGPTHPASLERMSQQGGGYAPQSYAPQNYAPQSGAPLPDTAQLQEMIRLEVERTFGKIAREVLPDIAERVIKAEIRKILEE